MLRTRDFILLFSIIVFLFFGIGTTLIDQWRDGRIVSNVGLPQTIASTSEDAYVATVPDTSIDRAGNLARLRDKIQYVMPAQKRSVISASADDMGTSTDGVEAELNAATSSLQLCETYQLYDTFWDARELTVELTENAIEVVSIPAEGGGQVTLRIPRQGVPVATPSCLPSDVAGVAMDGSLIRNNEVGVYQIFDEETQIGFALDGFPIYGRSSNEHDSCGGRVVNGSYQYELSDARDTVVDCFVGLPVVLP